MRKVYYFLFILFFSNALKAQITTVANPTPSGFSPFNQTLPVSTWTGYYARDAGTNAYVLHTSGSGVDNSYMILRQNNRWMFVQQLTGLVWQLNTHAVAQTVSNDIDPPCNDIWERHTASSTPQSANFIAPFDPTGEFFQLNITGNTCIQLPTQINAMTITPYALSLPQLINTTISTISNLQPGMVIWSLDDSCVKVFNGTTWNCL